MVFDEGVQDPETVTGTQLVQVKGLTVVVAMQDDEIYVGQLVDTDSVIVVGGKITTSVVVDVTVDWAQDVRVDGEQLVVPE